MLSLSPLNSSISNEEIQIADYVLFRSDRGSRGGGVATYVTSRLMSQLIIPQADPEYFECLFVKICFHHNKHLVIGNLYRPPSAPSESTKCILSTIGSLDCLSKLIILGDFNVNWLDRSSSNDKNSFASINLTYYRTHQSY